MFEIINGASKSRAKIIMDEKKNPLINTLLK